MNILMTGLVSGLALGVTIKLASMTIKKISSSLDKKPNKVVNTIKKIINSIYVKALSVFAICLVSYFLSMTYQATLSTIALIFLFLPAFVTMVIGWIIFIFSIDEFLEQRNLQSFVYLAIYFSIVFLSSIAMWMYSSFIITMMFLASFAFFEENIIDKIAEKLESIWLFITGFIPFSVAILSMKNIDFQDPEFSQGVPSDIAV